MNFSRTSAGRGPSARARWALGLAAALSIPLSLVFAGTALALGGVGVAPARAHHANISHANVGIVNPGASALGAATLVPYAADHKGSSFTGVGRGKPSGDVHRPQPFSRADRNNTGANDTSAANPYVSTRSGAPSLNGNGGGKQFGQPCAGCVGKADNKNPPGQAPNGTDRNAGYECDRNHGIGRSNPAHTGCTRIPPPTCVPVLANHHCNSDVVDCLGVLGGHATAAQCNPPKDCLGVVNGHATAAQCTSVRLCPDGSPMPASGNVADCVISGGGGGPATGPLTTPVIAPVTGVVDAPATAPDTEVGSGAVQPAELAFTGSNTAQLAGVAGVLLLLGAAMVLAARKPDRATGGRF